MVSDKPVVANFSDRFPRYGIWIFSDNHIRSEPISEIWAWRGNRTEEEHSETAAHTSTSRGLSTDIPPLQGVAVLGNPTKLAYMR
jgi:hypothetical protein